MGTDSSDQLANVKEYLWNFIVNWKAYDRLFKQAAGIRERVYQHLDVYVNISKHQSRFTKFDSCVNFHQKINQD